MPDNRTDHPTLRQLLMAFRRDYSEAVALSPEGDPPSALPEIEADLLCRIWGEAPNPNKPIDENTNLDILVDFNDKAQVQKITITMKPSVATLAIIAEATQEKIALMKTAFMKKVADQVAAAEETGGNDGNA